MYFLHMPLSIYQKHLFCSLTPLKWTHRAEGVNTCRQEVMGSWISTATGSARPFFICGVHTLVPYGGFIRASIRCFHLEVGFNCLSHEMKTELKRGLSVLCYTHSLDSQMTGALMFLSHYWGKTAQEGKFLFSCFKTAGLSIFSSAHIMEAV